MRSNKRYLYASIMLGVALVITVIFIYYSSAIFIETPVIVLPDGSTTQQQNIEYENNKITQDIVIDTSNFKEVIEKLQRPTTYSMSVLNDIYAYEMKKSYVTSVEVGDDWILASRDNVEYVLSETEVSMIKNNEKINFDKADFTNDDIIGIPSYEDVLQIDDVVSVSQITLNGEQTLKIEVSQEENYYIYTVSLVSGMLVQYEVFENNQLIRSVMVTNLVISN